MQLKENIQSIPALPRHTNLGKHITNLFYSRLCPLPESSIVLCPLLSLSMPFSVAPQCHLSNGGLVLQVILRLKKTGVGLLICVYFSGYVQSPGYDPGSICTGLQSDVSATLKTPRSHHAMLSLVHLGTCPVFYCSVMLFSLTANQHREPIGSVNELLAYPIRPRVLMKERSIVVHMTKRGIFGTFRLLFSYHLVSLGGFCCCCCFVLFCFVLFCFVLFCFV